MVRWDIIVESSFDVTTCAVARQAPRLTPISAASRLENGDIYLTCIAQVAQIGEQEIIISALSLF